MWKLLTYKHTTNGNIRSIVSLNDRCVAVNEHRTILDVIDLLKNDITAENTGLLLPEEYKNLDFIKKTFSDENGVFDDQKFTSFYKLASDKYADLTNNQAYESLKKELEYSPTSMSSPIGSKKFDV